MADLDPYQRGIDIRAIENVAVQVEYPFGDVYDNQTTSDRIIVKLPGLIWAIGEETPTAGETPVPWTALHDGDGVALSDEPWDQIELTLGQERFTDVFEAPQQGLFDLTIAQNVYGYGFDNASIFFRYSDKYFEKTAGVGPNEGPAWNYYDPAQEPYQIEATWVQFKIKGGQVV